MTFLLKKDIDLNGWKGYEYYYKTYNINCIKKKFMCYKFDISYLVNEIVPYEEP